jgi:hypothetical protein
VPVSPALETDYKQKKAELEDRHRSEIEHPRAGETAAARDARHEQERRDLDAAYDKARTGGAAALPRESESPH